MSTMFNRLLRIPPWYIYIIIALIAAELVIIAWLLTPQVIARWYDDLSQMGAFGDQFGSVNALFSGLAFALLIVTVLMQSRELGLQREELEATRNELRGAKEAQEKTNEVQQRTAEAQAYKVATDMLQPAEVRAARGTVLNNLKNVKFEREASWTHEGRDGAELVCSTFDTVGILVRHEHLPAEYIVKSWGQPLRESWKILEPFVKWHRDFRDEPEFWADYECLAR